MIYVIIYTGSYISRLKLDIAVSIYMLRSAIGTKYELMNGQ